MYFNLRVGRGIGLFPSPSRAAVSFPYNSTIKITPLPTLPQEVSGDENTASDFLLWGFLFPLEMPF